jgi:hypothetical protein
LFRETTARGHFDEMSDQHERIAAIIEGGSGMN